MLNVLDKHIKSKTATVLEQKTQNKNFCGVVNVHIWQGFL